MTHERVKNRCRRREASERMSTPAQRSLFPTTEGAHEREIRERWRHLIGCRLPKAALERNWSITADHCFARILLDVTSGRPWREIISPPAWRHTPIDQLDHAIRLGEALLDRPEAIDRLNEISLKLRRHRRASPAVTADTQQFIVDAGEA